MRSKRLARRFKRNKFIAWTVSIVLFLGIIAAIICLGTDMASTEILKINKVERNSEIIIEETEYGYDLTKTTEEDFRVLQLTDIHIGGGIACVKNDKLAINAVYDLVYASKPDFIVVTGDIAYPFPVHSGTINNRVSAKMFVDMMDAIGIPWTMVFGNHDTESYSLYSREQMAEFYSEVNTCLMERKNEYIYGYGNQIITLRNSDGKVNTALVMLDSNSYVPGIGINDYDYIHDDQVDWYENKIKEISLEDGREVGDNVPNMVFYHIPLKEFDHAVDLYNKGSDEVTYNQGYVRVGVSPSSHGSKLFDTALALGSTEAMFCGHDHRNNIDLTYKGIRLVYGLSIDYLAYAWFGIIDMTEQRGATIIDIAEDSSFTITQMRLCEIDRISETYQKIKK